MEKNTQPSTCTDTPPSSSCDKRPPPPSNDDGNDQHKRQKQTSTISPLPLPNNNIDTNTNNDNNTSDVSSSKMVSVYDTISSKLKLSQEQSIGDEKEGARPRTANEPLTIDDDDEEEEKWYICPPTASRSSANWKFFHVFNLNKHSKIKNKAACLICFREKKYNKGTVATAGGSTSGLKRHMTTHHRVEFEETIQKNATTSAANRINSYFHKKECGLGISDVKKMFRVAATLNGLLKFYPMVCSHMTF